MLFTIAAFRPSSRIPLTLWPSCPSRETRRTSFFWARISAEKALCSSGVRRDRLERSELMLRRVGWDSDAVEEVCCSSCLVASSDGGDRLER